MKNPYFNTRNFVTFLDVYVVCCMYLLVKVGVQAHSGIFSLDYLVLLFVYLLIYFEIRSH